MKGVCTVQREEMGSAEICARRSDGVGTDGALRIGAHVPWRESASSEPVVSHPPATAQPPPATPPYPRPDVPRTLHDARQRSIIYTRVRGLRPVQHGQSAGKANGEQRAPVRSAQLSLQPLRPLRLPSSRWLPPPVPLPPVPPFCAHSLHARTQPDERKDGKKKASSASAGGSKKKPDTGSWPCKMDGCKKVFAREADLKRHQRTTKTHSIPGLYVARLPLCRRRVQNRTRRPQPVSPV